MKDYKLLLAGLLVLILLIFIGIFTWLWSSNRKNADPLPIMATESEQSTSASGDDINTIATSILHVQAEEQLQAALDDVIMKFESRYPNTQVLALYVPAKSLLTLPGTSNANNEPSSLPIHIDVIIADEKIAQTRLIPLQALLNDAQTKLNHSEINTRSTAQDNLNPVNANPATSNDSIEARHLASFSYAVKNTDSVDGVILTDNPIAVSFRNFLLSSAGQDILKKYGYDNIDGYKNSVDDLFNPASRGKKASGQPSVKVADALSNGT